MLQTILFWASKLLAGAIAGVITHLFVANALMSLVCGGESFGSSNRLGYWYFGLIIGIPIAIVAGAISAGLFCHFCRYVDMSKVRWLSLLAVSAGIGVLWPLAIFLFYTVSWRG